MTDEIDFKSKKQSITFLTEIFNLWNNLLSSYTEQQVASTFFHTNRSIKDDIAHLWFWQKLSVARMEAALDNCNPVFDYWPKDYQGPPEREEDTDGINEWAFQSTHEKSWSDVYKSWKETFTHLINLAKQIEEKNLLEPRKFSWLEGYPLIAVLSGTYNHHNEHLEKILGKETKK